jgi:urease accessory protein
LGLVPEQVLVLALHAFASNLVSVAVRFVPLGQTEGQAVLAGLHPLIAAIAREAAEAGLDDIGTAALAADLAAMQHETMDVRIYRT